MANQLNEGEKPTPKRKPIWPWLVLLVLTLATIFIYERVSEMIDQVMRDFNDLVRFIEQFIPER